jgi:hypothetical protein
MVSSTDSCSVGSGSNPFFGIFFLNWFFYFFQSKKNKMIILYGIDLIILYIQLNKKL